jgi:hypothetical protein
MPVFNMRGPFKGAADEHVSRTRRAGSVLIGARADGFPDQDYAHYGAPPLPGSRGDYEDRAAPPHENGIRPSQGITPFVLTRSD